MSRDTVHGCPTTSVDERYRQSRRRPARRDSPHLLQEACAVNRPVSSSGVAPMAQVVLRRCRGRNGRPAPSQRYARAMHHRSAVEQCASRVPGSPVLMARRYVAKPVSNRERAGKPRNGSPLADPCAAATAGWPVPTWTTASSTSSGTETARRVGSWPPAGPPPSEEACPASEPVRMARTSAGLPMASPGGILQVWSAGAVRCVRSPEGPREEQCRTTTSSRPCRPAAAPTTRPRRSLMRRCACWPGGSRR
jgi:hypothetical protein